MAASSRSTCFGMWERQELLVERSPTTSHFEKLVVACHISYMVQLIDKILAEEL